MVILLSEKEHVQIVDSFIEAKLGPCARILTAGELLPMSDDGDDAKIDLKYRIEVALWSNPQNTATTPLGGS